MLEFVTIVGLAATLGYLAGTERPDRIEAPQAPADTPLLLSAPEPRRIVARTGRKAAVIRKTRKG
jgi:hypothetical protein